MPKQVDKEHYDFSRYCYFDRWASYYYQLREILACTPKSVLEIGVGDGVVKSYLKEHTNIAYTNLDIAEDLHPDILGTVQHIPLPDHSHDGVCAFEVLEHLPFDQFESALAEMSRVSRNHVLISLPHFGPPVAIDIKIPFLPRIRGMWKIPFPKEHVFNGQHYWEIGKKGYSIAAVRALIRKRFSIVKEFVPYESPYHHFFILKPL